MPEDLPKHLQELTQKLPEASKAMMVALAAVVSPVLAVALLMSPKVRGN